MLPIDVEALRDQVRAMDYLRGTPDQVALWREDNENSRANLMIEGFQFEPDEDAMFDMFLEEGVPPSLVPSLILTLYGLGITAPDLADAVP
ncbi:hypothetical protein GS397_27735 (plasmid) [Sphingobium yanoikuyae]|uniref:Uncharacterized protein n=1 Tax=Sphingobium yanoikuyae TaxID=13690 RepID=A0A6P1GU29_SPHYA|nr:hypothetical protein [Sphingobium yanoikuyae]QHD70891.1 hypothetical protein GS397_27735 [Sphingobium yanoikuyae]